MKVEVAVVVVKTYLKKLMVGVVVVVEKCLQIVKKRERD
jgi:hypothetical protein